MMIGFYSKKITDRNLIGFLFFQIFILYFRKSLNRKVTNVKKSAFKIQYVENVYAKVIYQ